MAIRIIPDNQISQSSDTLGTPDAVTICSAPTNGRRIVKNIVIWNDDTVVHSWEIFLVSSGTSYKIRQAPSTGTLAADAVDSMYDDWDYGLVVLKPGQSLTAVMNAVETTRQAQYIVFYVDEE